MKKIKAFTLAEVLITLAIIGVVAALTIPTVVTNYKNKALETQRKKAMSVLANGFKLLMAEDNVTELKNTKLAMCDHFDKSCYINEIKRIFNVISDNTSGNGISDVVYQFDWGSKAVWDSRHSRKYKMFVTSDGMIFGFGYLSSTAEGATGIMVDVNGIKNPNKGGQDLCKYFIFNNGTIEERCTEMANWEEPEPTCDSSHHSLCSNQADCESAGGNWTDTAACKEGPCPANWECL